jgi:hypothetical protein
MLSSVNAAGAASSVDEVRWGRSRTQPAPPAEMVSRSDTTRAWPSASTIQRPSRPSTTLTSG